MTAQPYNKVEELTCDDTTLDVPRLQCTVCRLLAQNRIASGESYVAGDAALNELRRVDWQLLQGLPPFAPILRSSPSAAHTLM